MEEMMMVGDIGVEIGTPRLNHDFAQQPGGLKLVQGIVNGGEGDPDAVGLCPSMQRLGRHMAIAIRKQKTGKGQALTRRPQPDGFQPIQGGCIGAR